MCQRARERAEGEGGFTLIELLVVILIVAILAAVAIPSFLSRKVTAGDAAAKALVHSAQNAAASYGLSSNYTGMTPAALHALEPTINVTANGKAVLVNAVPTVTGYILTVVASTANTFYLTNSAGVVTRTCIVAPGNGNTTTNTGGGCNAGNW